MSRVYQIHEAKTLLSQDLKIAGVCKTLDPTEQISHCRRKEYASIRTEQSRRNPWRFLSAIKVRLKKLLAKFELDQAIEREVASGNFSLQHRCDHVPDDERCFVRDIFRSVISHRHRSNARHTTLHPLPYGSTVTLIH